jgi:adenylate cyclase
MMTQAKHVLVVDDDDAILETLRDILEFEGYQVETLQDGTRILEQIHLNPPAMVLLDLRMPGLDGRQVFQSIKADPQAADIPVVLVTADDSGSSYAGELGTVDFIAKPFKLDQLFACIERFMGQPTETAQ